MKHRQQEEQCDCDQCEMETPSSGAAQMAAPNIRMVGLYGPIEPQRSLVVISTLYALKEEGLYAEEQPQKEGSDPIPPKIQYEPIDFVVSTEGGNVFDMFAMYDVIKECQKDGCDINTVGLGKVMSAGLLLLACGTKGKRKIGKNCRLMLHAVSGGTYGTIHNLKIDMKEAKVAEEKYIDALVSETGGKLSKKILRKYFNKNMDFYFNAEQAIEFGLVDIIM